MKGLVIKSPWIELILEGKKSWEVRGSNTKIRGKIALIKSGSGKVFGTAELVDCIPLKNEELSLHFHKHQIPEDRCNIVSYRNTHAWVLANPTVFKEPIPYSHPQGAVIWVNLSHFIHN